MVRRSILIPLYVAGSAACVAIVAGVVAMLAGPASTPRGPQPVRPVSSTTAPLSAPNELHPPAQPPRPPPAPADTTPLTSTAPAVATNGRITIRLLGGLPGQ